MKKSRMLLLFGGLFLMLVSYVAWCGRTFYLRSPMPDLSSMPADAQASARAGIEKWKLGDPEAFSGGKLMKLLMSPYDSDLPPIQVRQFDESWWTFRREGCSSGFHLLRLSNGWTSVSTKRGIW